ncbi:probable amino acid permease 7 isoform X1 [Neltuma alba]|uniref:probable amino acid permease 7 isoform X1 n=1 Tax=Neltuma alba TaxID=207710 RepID=UPI0010A3C884|nr:probable amino acid permease 7 isoform X1 [Prosopis alba]
MGTERNQMSDKMIESTPLITHSSDSGHNNFDRTGNVWSAAAHIITGVIGAGVLSLAWATAQLGWIAGPLCIILFAITTLVSVYLLCDCYRFPHPETGELRNRSFTDAVKLYLGETNKKFCTVLVNESLCGTTIAYVFTTASSVSVSSGPKRTWLAGFCQYLNLCGTSIAYVITTATSLRAILKSNCYHKYGHHARCHYGETLFMVLFGVVQFFMSFIPDLHNMAWVSIVAAIMSFSYSFIGLGLGIAKVIENGTIKGSITGVPTSNAVEKLWLVFQALGDVAFAYPYSVILLEIQDTLKSPPPENQTMKKASMISVLVTTFFYLCCGCFGYAAFGSNTPGNLLTGFGFYEPFWLVDFANACIVVHLVGGYQVLVS